MAGDRVVVDFGRLVGHTHADQVGRDDPVADIYHRGDLVAPDVGPGGVAVQHHHDRRVWGAGVDQVDTQGLTVTGRDLNPSPFGRITGYRFDGFVGSPQDLHSMSPKDRARLLMEARTPSA